MWMDDGSGRYGDSGKSKYTEALKYLIDGFMDHFRHVIDPDRVYIGGDPNGGFMTVRMLMSYPDTFAAAFPIWFTHAKNDPVVKPELYAVPTYNRLMAAGAQNCHFTYWDRIVDMRAGFKNEKGEPYEYLGHFAWLPVFNDDCRLDFDGTPVMCNGQEATLMTWLAAQKKGRWISAAPVALFPAQTGDDARLRRVSVLRGELQMGRNAGGPHALDRDAGRGGPENVP